MSEVQMWSWLLSFELVATGEIDEWMLRCLADEIVFQNTHGMPSREAARRAGASAR